MSNSTITAWSGEISGYSVQDSMDINYGVFVSWESAQHYAKSAVNNTLPQELYIKRGADTLEIVQVDQDVLPLKIAGGVCNWCQDKTDVVCIDNLYICQECSGECGEGENVWNYLRG